MVGGDHPCAGSPPHARGARRCSSLFLPLPRITPACAGSTTRSMARSAGLGDHPRMRGEHLPRGDRLSVGDGSPPHARGAQLRDHAPPDPRRITPACAGSTSAVSWTVSDETDHPRMRGEHTSVVRAAYPREGSPPHARGARPTDHPAGRPGGITPACAGSTSGWLLVARHLPDHPRMRGEHTT